MKGFASEVSGIKIEAGIPAPKLEKAPKLRFPLWQLDQGHSFQVPIAHGRRLNTVVKILNEITDRHFVTRVGADEKDI